MIKSLRSEASLHNRLRVSMVKYCYGEDILTQSREHAVICDLIFIDLICRINDYLLCQNSMIHIKMCTLFLFLSDVNLRLILRMWGSCQKTINMLHSMLLNLCAQIE